MHESLGITLFDSPLPLRVGDYERTEDSLPSSRMIYASTSKPFPSEEVGAGYAPLALSGVESRIYIYSYLLLGASGSGGNIVLTRNDSRLKKPVV